MIHEYIYDRGEMPPALAGLAGRAEAKVARYMEETKARADAPCEAARFAVMVTGGNPSIRREEVCPSPKNYLWVLRSLIDSLIHTRRTDIAICVGLASGKTATWAISLHANRTIWYYDGDGLDPIPEPLLAWAEGWPS